MNAPLPRARFRIANVKRFEKNTLRGFYDLESPRSGMIIRGCALHEKAGKRWVSWPAKPYTKDDGTTSWSCIVDFVDNKSKYSLQNEILPLVEAAFAEASQ